MPSAPSPEHDDGQAIERGALHRLVGAVDRETLADIEAEIADHLASAAAEQMLRGQGPDQADAVARRRFGDIASVRRKCWWIQTGDRIMLRCLAIGLGCTLSVVVLALGVGGWRVQAALADRLDAVADRLASLHRDQERLQSREIPEIRGRAHFADASRVAANVEIQIWNASEMKVFRRVRTDAEGRFRSHPLPAGDYFIFAPLLTADANEAYANVPGKRSLLYRLQSPPLFAYPGTRLDELTLDLRLRSGQLSLEMVKEHVPGQEASVGPAIRYRSQLVLAPLAVRGGMPIDPNGPVSDVSWPLIGATDDGPWSENKFDVKFGGTSAEPLQNYPVLLPGGYQVAVYLAADIVSDTPVNDESKHAQTWQAARAIWEQNFPSYPPFAKPKDSVAFEVVEGKRTHLRVIVPAAIETRVCDLSERQSEKFNEIRDALEPKLARIEILTGQAPLPAANPSQP
ncbi:MAG TPA: permease prefix domain 1-containing protein [Pirellulales bacterium]|nr:permease prefix domain 1-containing protein [Pirellulales bacterium]